MQTVNYNSVLFYIDFIEDMGCRDRTKKELKEKEYQPNEIAWI